MAEQALALLLSARHLPPKEAFAVPAHEAQKGGNWAQETTMDWDRPTVGSLACTLLLVPLSYSAWLRLQRHWPAEASSSTVLGNLCL